ncbi:peptide deformylase, partial [Acinetobacter baumannii]
MAELKILHYPEPVLLSVGKPVEYEEINTDFRSTVEEMFRLMYDAGGVGLAAPQVGISKRFFIM